MARRDHKLARISPLSAFRVGLAMSALGLVAWLFAVCLLYLGLNQVGIWDSINSLVSGVGGAFTLTFGVVLSAAAVVGAIFAVLGALLAPLIAVIYNAIADVFGGLDIQLEQREKTSSD